VSPAGLSRGRLARFAWAVLAFNLAVIVWGAWVRVSGSGAGCGSHWPLCDGEVVPRSLPAEKAIEFTHRATSGLALLAVVALAVTLFRARPRRDPARRAAAAAVLFILLEAALGAGLVLFELVAQDDSLARAVVLPLHLLNTFLLLAALALTARFAGGSPAPPPGALRRAGGAWPALLVLLVLAGASGAIAALGDTLFPASSLAEAFRQDLDPAAHALLRARAAHPLLAVVAAGALLAVAARRAARGTTPPGLRAAAALALAQLAVGVVNLALLAPAPLQLAHLLLADLLWIATLLAAAADLAGERTG